MWDFICEYILPVLFVILIILGISTIGIALYWGINSEEYITKTITIQTENNICNCIRNNTKEES